MRCSARLSRCDTDRSFNSTITSQSVARSFATATSIADRRSDDGPTAAGRASRSADRRRGADRRALGGRAGVRAVWACADMSIAGRLSLLHVSLASLLARKPVGFGAVSSVRRSADRRGLRFRRTRIPTYVDIFVRQSVDSPEISPSFRPSVGLSVHAVVLPFVQRSIRSLVLPTVHQFVCLSVRVSPTWFRAHTTLQVHGNLPLGARLR